MPAAEARIRTPRAGRFLTQFCRHAQAMGGRAQHLHGDGRELPDVLRVECNDTEGTVEFTWGRCVLRSTSDTLTIHVESDDEERLRRIQDILAADFERFGRRDGLKVSWSGTEPSTVDAEAGTRPSRPQRGTTIALVVAVVLAVSAHVLVGGAALASWRWTSVAADVLLAVVVLKIAVVALLARRRLRGHRALKRMFRH